MLFADFDPLSGKLTVVQLKAILKEVKIPASNLKKAGLLEKVSVNEVASLLAAHQASLVPRPVDGGSRRLSQQTKSEIC